MQLWYISISNLGQALTFIFNNSIRFEYYQPCDVPEITEDQSPNKTGVIALMNKVVSYGKIILQWLNNDFIFIQEADAVVGLFACSEKRNRLVDYPYISSMSPMTLMIPKPTAQKVNRIHAIVQPFEPIVILFITLFIFQC